MFPVPEHALDTWRSKVAVASALTVALSTAMTRSLLDNMSCDFNQRRGHLFPNAHEAKSAIFSIANDLQAIMGEAMKTAIAIFPYKPIARRKGTLPHHL
jgi:hypothetical protein